MKQVNLKKIILPKLPYFFLGLYATKLGQAWRLAPGIKDFECVARKYGVDYAIKRDRNHDPPRFLIFYKSRDADALTAAMQEYAGRKVKKAQRPSVLQKLAQFKEMVKDSSEKVRKKVLER